MIAKFLNCQQKFGFHGKTGISWCFTGCSKITRGNVHEKLVVFPEINYGILQMSWITSRIIPWVKIPSFSVTPPIRFVDCPSDHWMNRSPNCDSWAPFVGTKTSLGIWAPLKKYVQKIFRKPGDSSTETKKSTATQQIHDLFIHLSIHLFIYPFI